MKSLVLEKNKKIIYKETETPSPKSYREVLARVISSSVCSSDIPRAFNNGAYFYPIILGHEIFTEEGVVYPLIPCKKCSICKTGQVNTCKNYDYIGSRRNGGFSEYVLVPRDNIIKVPKALDPVLAAITEPTSVVMHAFKKAQPLKNDKILIIGDGPMGMILSRLLIYSGHSQVYLSGKHEYKTKIVRKFGARVIYSEQGAISEKHDSFFDVVFEIAGTDSAYKNAVMAVKPHGKIVLIGNIRDNLVMEKTVFSQILRKELRIIGSWNSLPQEWGQALKFLNKSPEIKIVVSHVFSLKDGVKAMNDIYSRLLKNYTKAVFLAD